MYFAVKVGVTLGPCYKRLSLRVIHSVRVCYTYPSRWVRIVEQSDSTINKTILAPENNSILDCNILGHYYHTPLFPYIMLHIPRNNCRNNLYSSLNIFQYEYILAIFVLLSETVLGYMSPLNSWWLKRKDTKLSPQLRKVIDSPMVHFKLTSHLGQPEAISKQKQTSQISIKKMWCLYLSYNFLIACGSRVPSLENSLQNSGY